jgi:hypothetical protein
METMDLHIKTDGRYLRVFKELARALGATVVAEAAPNQKLTLEQIIEEGERDFREGNGIKLTIEQLQAMVG